MLAAVLTVLSKELCLPQDKAGTGSSSKTSLPPIATVTIKIHLPYIYGPQRVNVSFPPCATWLTPTQPRHGASSSWPRGEKFLPSEYPEQSKEPASLMPPARVAPVLPSPAHQPRVTWYRCDWKTRSQRRRNRGTGMQAARVTMELYILWAA